MGALFATVGGLYIHLPPVLEVIVLVLLAMLGGALWAGLAALLRMLFNMSEFIVTLMLNMVADFFTAWAIAGPFMDKTAFSPMTPQIDKAGWLPSIGNFNTTILFMIVAVGISWFVFNRWKAGYEWRLSGQNSLVRAAGRLQYRPQFRFGDAVHRRAGWVGRRAAGDGRTAPLFEGSGRQL